MVPAPGGRNKPWSLPGPRPPIKSSPGRAWEPGLLALREIFTATSGVGTGQSIWAGGCRLDVYITEFSGKDSAGVSLAGTAHSCMSCAGRSYPPFISEVSTLAGCLGRHRRGFLKTCSQASCFCCGSVMDRTGPLVPQHHLQIGAGHQTRKGREMGGGKAEGEDSKTKGVLPPPFHPRMPLGGKAGRRV